jgi:hypothetical protein
VAGDPAAATYGRAPPHGVGLAREVLRVAARPSYEDDARARLADAGVAEAVARRDTARLFAWLCECLAYQGVSNRTAEAHLARHGRAEHAPVAAALAAGPACPRLASLGALAGCGYRKLARACAEPALLPGCPLPRLPLRNGRLNTAAYGLALFLRDTCGGDLVGWLDEAIAGVDAGGLGDGDPGRPARLRAALLGPLLAVPGAGAKVLSMALAELLVGADPRRLRYVCVRAGFVAGPARS